MTSNEQAAPVILGVKGQREHTVRTGIFVAVTLVWFVFVLSAAAQGQSSSSGSAKALAELSLEDLTNVEVVTVARNPEKLTTVAAAVTVITGEDIRRSGATSIPDALRRVPGLHVAQVDSNDWATGIRGFTSRLSRSMLVLIDGRSVYTPLFAGVYWQVQDTLLEDIDRIEVIRGPGATLWGANAVNGIINIVTKSSTETQGGLLVVGGGSYEHGFTGFRYGGTAGPTTHYRIYGKFFDRGDFFHSAGGSDDWRMGQTGFRADSTTNPKGAWTVQGDLYLGRAGQRTSINSFSPPFLQTTDRDIELSGGNLLGRWRRTLRSPSELSVQAYYDRTNRTEPAFEEHRDTFDLDFQHRLAPIGEHGITWGAGYRVSSGEATGVPTIVFTPQRRTDQLVTSFLQDEVTLLTDRLRLAFGSRFSHNDYSGYEYQPTARISWFPGARQTLWASFVRAIRTPSRVEHDLSASVLIDPSVPVFARVVGDPRFESEKVYAFQLGYRVQPTSAVFVSVDLFYNSYQDLLSLEPGAPFVETLPAPTRTVLPLSIANRMGGKGKGGEVTYDWTPRSWWRFGGAYSYLELDLKPDAASLDTSTQRSTEGASPRHQVTFHSYLNLPRNFALDFAFRYIDRLPSQQVGAYASLDARLGWQKSERLELGLVGRNLLQDHHAEFGGGSAGIAEVTRSVYGRVIWRW